MSLLSSYFIACPYCMEQFEITVDLTAGTQQYVEDCEVCCNPVLFDIRMQGGEIIDVTAVRENE